MTDLADLTPTPTETAVHKAEKWVEDFIQRGGKTELRFHGEAGAYKELTQLPWNITHAQQAKHIGIPGTKISDIRPLTSLPNLQSLDIRDSEVEDLRPVLEMPHLYRSPSSPQPVQSPGLQFSGCKATQLDPRLKEISEIEDGQERYIQTVRYLSTLPQYPAFLPHEEERMYKRASDKIDAFSEKTDERASRLAEFSQTFNRERTQVNHQLGKQLLKGRDIFQGFRQTIDEANQAIHATKSELDAFKAEFKERIAVTGPVELWADKQAEHKEHQRVSFGWFLFGLGLTAALAVVIIISPFLFPDQINTLFSAPGCDASAGAGCTGFSLHSALVIAAILTIFTVALWFTRLQMKLYLAERHMRLDAREREAFTKAYIGLLSQGDTSKEAADQRALVYGALFRPSSDGTVKDDGGLDPAIAAGLSKLLAK
ncbi:DUF6161 domain-containing protein [Halocynthiibacter namhaensis]|uniref:DUF6161 domain-containing protein n=1 Tax=Halocynthiibacter namhaensis TaxID=1290553 RepID=UPI00068B3D2F|nr:DUF6161 domain-containing protein [Halocynthiibacter namhaensis]